MGKTQKEVYFDIYNSELEAGLKEGMTQDKASRRANAIAIKEVRKYTLSQADYLPLEKPVLDKKNIDIMAIPTNKKLKLTPTEVDKFC